MDVLRRVLCTAGPKARCIDANVSLDSVQLIQHAYHLAHSIARLLAPIGCGLATSAQARVALLTRSGCAYTAATYATWLNGAVAVPIGLSHPAHEAEYVLRDANAAAVLATDESAEFASQLAHRVGAHFMRFHVTHSSSDDDVENENVVGSPPDLAQLQLADVRSSDGALVIYTSGTTGKPKGALHTHGSLGAQVSDLCSAWEWNEDDRIYHALPLHHIHGIVNAFLCAHYAGATIEFAERFSPSLLWERLRDASQPPVSVFMGVPTMYIRLLQTFDAYSLNDRQELASSASKLRLWVCGSSSCPSAVFQRWYDLTAHKYLSHVSIAGHTLLERYGMTETGMVLSNPYRGERVAGTVGYPLNSVHICIRPEEGGDEHYGPGELLVKGDTLFQEYINKPEATADSFDENDYFITGDIVERERDTGRFVMLGRRSVDIIKTGGFKVSALEVESALQELDMVAEVSVCGAPDNEYGERVCALVALQGDLETNGFQSDDEAAEAVRDAAKATLAPPKVPAKVMLVQRVPRNSMGKVNKREIANNFFS